MPKTIEAYNDVVFMCHPWDELQFSLPPMDTVMEGNIISTLLMDINNNFKWDLDKKSEMSRSVSRANSAQSPVTGVITGSSNAGLLSNAFTDLGKVVITLATGGWCVSKENVDALLPKLQKLLEGLDPSVPVILWCLDNSAFKVLNQNGDLTSVSRLAKNKKFHIIGDLTVTLFCLLNSVMREMDRIVLACRQHRVSIFEVCNHALTWLTVLMCVSTTTQQSRRGSSSCGPG